MSLTYAVANAFSELASSGQQYKNPKTQLIHRTITTGQQIKNGTDNTD